MWQLKEFKSEIDMSAWIEKNKARYQITEVFINNGYCVEYKPFKVINIE